MKVSLWHQFSSNHSASFIVVGQFESEAWAEQVATEVRLIIREIGEWWQQLPDEEWKSVHDELERTNQLTPPERTIQQRYQISNWRRRSRTPLLDWVRYEQAPEAVHRIGTLVTINQQALSLCGDTWFGPAPFDEILRKLGGAVVASCAEFDWDFSINIRGIAPDAETAQRIVKQVEIIERGERRLVRISGHYITNGHVSCDGPHILIERYEIAANYWGNIALKDLRPHHHVIERQNQWVRIESSFEEELQCLLNELEEQGVTDIEYRLEDISENPII
jgi:hypothetical protein